MRVQLIVPDSTLIVPETFARLLSAVGRHLRRPLLRAPGAWRSPAYIVPLQIGARGVAFPRLNLLSAWLYIAGGVVLYTSFVYTPGEGGVLGLPPLSDTVFNPGRGMDNWIMGVGLATAGFVLWAVNMIVTVRRMRAPGMAWRRLPLFSWATTVISYVLLVVGPVMLAALAMLTIDRHFDGVFFDAGEGGAPLLYEHLAYIFMSRRSTRSSSCSPPASISEILPTMARKPIFSHRAVAALDGRDRRPDAARLDAEHVLGADPGGLPVRGDGGRRWRSRCRSGPSSSSGSRPCGAGRCASTRRCSTPAAAHLGDGAAASRASWRYSVIPVGWQLANTTASQGDTLYVLAGGAVFGGFAALHYWLPKMTGRERRRGPAQRRRCWRCSPALNLYVADDVLRRPRGPAGRHLPLPGGRGPLHAQPVRLARRVPVRDRRLPRAGEPGARLPQRPRRPGTTRGAARRSSGSRSPRPRRTTSTRSPTCAAPSRCWTSATPSAAVPAATAPPYPERDERSRHSWRSGRGPRPLPPAHWRHDRRHPASWS